MKQSVVYILLLIIILSSCEEIYHPDLDTTENFLFVEGRFIADLQINNVKLFKSLDFYSNTKTYPPVSGARITLNDDKGSKIVLTEIQSGIYQLDYLLNQDRKYFITIELDGDIYESTIQPVPQSPVIDTVYGRIETKVTLEDGENSTDDIVSERGVQLYTDLKNEGALKHYVFYGREVLQFIYYIDSIIEGELMQVPVYGWKSFSPSGIFNIAGPPEFSTKSEIIKHPLEFFGNYEKLIADTQYFNGWIYSVYQYGITEENYKYYKDLNSQLDAKGKIFDPVYVQAEGNISCTSNPEIVVLGNFEILSYEESRYFLMYNNRSETVSLKKIPYFYNIPSSGEIVEFQPDFWESMNKRYP